MNLRELEAQAEFLAPVIAAAVAKAVAPLREALSQKEQQIDALHKRIDALPSPIEPDLEAIAALVVLPEVKDGKDAEPVDLEALAKAAAEFVQLPKVDLALLAAEAAALVVMPEPIAGKDADPVDLQELARAAAALIPAPEVKQPHDGRDALELEILPTIDESKQYARGTYAAFRGGLWRSYERTHGMRGWECIVDGVDGVSVAQDGERAFSVRATKSSGVTVAEKFEMPIQIYKGVHRDGDEYAAHDTVTWGGSQWVSNKSANTDKPGANDSWTLCVKAGRAGKDLRENASAFDPAKGVSLK
jgi:hypothetical protein